MQPLHGELVTSGEEVLGSPGVGLPSCMALTRPGWASAGTDAGTGMVFTSCGSAKKPRVSLVVFAAENVQILYNNPEVLVPY